MSSDEISQDYLNPPEHPFWRSLHNYLVPYVHMGESALANLQSALGVVQEPHRNIKCVGDECIMTEIPATLYSHPHVSNSFIYTIMRLASEFGNEPCYALWATTTVLFFPWDVSLPLAFIWSLGMYCGHFLKDYLRLPRPALTPLPHMKNKNKVIRLETHYAAEFGFPSTHAFGSSGLALYTLLVLQDFQVISYPMYILYSTIIAFWLCLTPLSRLYLGVHSFLDIVGGLVLGLIFSLTVYTVRGALASCLYTVPGALGVVALYIGLLYLYPQMPRWTNSFGDTALIMGTASGIFCAVALSPYYSPAHYITAPASLYDLGLLVGTLTFTIVTMYGLREVLVKPVVIRLARLSIGRSPVPTLPMPEKRTVSSSIWKYTYDLPLNYIYFVETSEKFCGFFCMPMFVYCVTPLLTHYLSITPVMMK